MSKVIDTGYVEIKPQIARDFAASASRQTSPALKRLQSDYDAAAGTATRSAQKVTAADGKIRASALRVTAAQERLNQLRERGVTDTARLASAEASLITAQDRLTASQRRQTVAQTEQLRVLGSASSRFGGARIAAIGGNLRSIAAVGGGFAALNVLKSSVNAASDLNETVSKSGVIFGDASAGVLKFARNAEQIGLSEQQAAEAAASFGALFTNLGKSDDAAAKMSTRLVRLAEDLASINNQNPADVLAALQSGLAGETEPLRRLNIFLNDATLKQTALDQGLIKTTTGTLPPAIRAQATYAEILKQGAYANGDYKRTQDGLANSTRNLSAEWNNAKAELGAGLLPVAKDATGVLRKDVVPAVREVGKALNFLGEHDGLRHGLEILAIGGAARALLAHRAAQRTVVDNTEVAASYDRIAGAASRAATAETRASAAGGFRGIPAGRLRGAAGLAGTAGLAIGGSYLSQQGNPLLSAYGNAAQGAALGTVIAPGIGTAAGAALALAPSEAAAAWRIGQGRASTSDYVLGLTSGVGIPVAAASALKTGFSHVPGVGHFFDGGGDDGADNAKREEAARQRISRLIDATNQRATAGYLQQRDGIDRIDQALARVGGRLREDRKHAEDFAEPLFGEKADGKTLGADRLLARAKGNVDTVVNRLKGERSLLRQGLDRSLLPDITALDKEAPGTAQRLARTLSDAEIKQLNDDAQRRHRAAMRLATLGDHQQQHELEQAAHNKGQRLARAVSEGFELGLSNVGGLQAQFTRGNVTNVNLYGPVNDIDGVAKAHRNATRRRALTAGRSR